MTRHTASFGPEAGNSNSSLEHRPSLAFRAPVRFVSTIVLTGSAELGLERDGRIAVGQG